MLARTATYLNINTICVSIVNPNLPYIHLDRSERCQYMPRTAVELSLPRQNYCKHARIAVCTARNKRPGLGVVTYFTARRFTQLRPFSPQHENESAKSCTNYFRKKSYFDQIIKKTPYSELATFPLWKIERSKPIALLCAEPKRFTENK